MSGVNDVNEAEAIQLALEAKRYRFIRQFGNPDFEVGFDPPEEPTTVEQYDALIDYAIARTKFEA